MSQQRSTGVLPYDERLTDIDIAILLIGLMGDPCDFPKTHNNPINDKNTSFEMVKGIVRTFTNPLAKELVMERITG